MTRYVDALPTHLSTNPRKNTVHAPVYIRMHSLLQLCMTSLGKIESASSLFISQMLPSFFAEKLEGLEEQPRSVIASFAAYTTACGT
jgi:hypothetical protein